MLSTWNENNKLKNIENQTLEDSDFFLPEKVSRMELTKIENLRKKIETDREKLLLIFREKFENETISFEINLKNSFSRFFSSASAIDEKLSTEKTDLRLLSYIGDLTDRKSVV